MVIESSRPVAERFPAGSPHHRESVTSVHRRSAPMTRFGTPRAAIQLLIDAGRKRTS